jgi:hypothetical protein
MGPVLIVSVVTTLLSQIALVVGRGAFWTALLFGAAIVTIPLDIVLVPWASDRFDNGGLGGAFAFVVTELVQLILGVAIVAPYLVSVSSVWRTFRVLCAGLLMVAAAWPFRELLFVVPAVVGAIAYSIAVYSLRVFNDYERHMLGSLFARVGIRNRWADRTER